MSSLGNRIRALRLKHKLTQGQLGKAVGVSDVTVSYWERDLNEPGGKSLSKLSKLMGVSDTYLLYGHIDSSLETSALAGAIKIPIINYAQAISWNPQIDGDFFENQSGFVVTTDHFQQGMFALKISEKSMSPDFVEGDLIILSPELTPKPGDYVLAKNNLDEVIFRKYRARGINDYGKETFELVPSNNDYAIRKSEQEDFSIIGVLIEHRRLIKR